MGEIDLPLEEKALADVDRGVEKNYRFSDHDDNDDGNGGKSFEIGSFNCACGDDGNDDDDLKFRRNESLATAERADYWQAQDSLIQEMLEQHYSTGRNFRQKISEIIELARETNSCQCADPKAGGSCCCSKCLRQGVVGSLCSHGFNATLCTSKWRSTPKLPAGTHEYIEVIARTQSRKKQVPFLIELGFRDEFKMAKACDEYHGLVNRLPEIYVGRADHLNAIVRVVCDAAKRSAAEKRIHMGPWRKRNFMQKKWSVSSRLLRQSSASDDELAAAAVTPARKADALLAGPCLRFSAATAVEVV
ncbi:hypothetical protein U1Q18_036904 [Sarracenia purpurea var. burkii]